MSVHGSELVASNLANADKLEGMNSTQGVVAHGDPVHVDPTALGLNGTAWVSLAMIAVILLMLWKKVPALIAAMLDKRIAAIREQLDAASRLRAEAEALKAEYEARASASVGEAEAIRVAAEEEAAAILAKAQVDAAALIDRRGRMAEDRIGAAERAAIAEVRAKAASVAAAAAAQLIADRHDAATDKALVDRTISGIGSARLN
ncbi:MAG: synthase subunit [Sphingomonas bacterium]|nr:synthase subunit [Sphingomonas bacterium]MDB5684039.1 synthase subunit [Sphingomonas bacterium]MDB5719241.1 synthase subunit [Sphingomonas bacterium]